MYAEWLSLAETIQSQSSKGNVLHSFPPDVGREVVASIIRPLQELVLGKSYKDGPLSSPEQVQWTMQVVGYGLTLPLSELSLLQGCVDVYHDWLTALYFQKHTVPLPIVKDPNYYAEIIFDQLCSLFVPRENEPRLLEDHAFLCKKVVDMVQSLVAIKGLKMTRDTWGSLFTFLLHICDLLLAPPTSQAPSLGTALCESLIHVLFAAWVRACQDTFPSPNLWKTLRELCCNWRHYPSLIKEWCQLMYSLTFKVIFILYGSKHLSIMTPLPQQDNDFFGLVKELSNDAAVQCWFRMLHTLGNPIDLLYPDIITGTPAFLQVIKESDATPPPDVQKCIDQLPVIFHSLMKGVSLQVNLFLGEKSSQIKEKRPSHTPRTMSRTSPSMRRKDPSKSQFYVPSPQQSPRAPQDSFYVNIVPDRKSPPIPGIEVPLSRNIEGIIGKPKVNTLLHIFGNWLFEASVWAGQDQEGFLSQSEPHPTSTKVTSSAGDLSRILFNLSILSYTLTPSQQKVREYEAGRAEALGTLCSIFSHLSCGEDVLHIYLARFYHSIIVGLNYDPRICSGQVLTRIILGSVSLLRKDLPGINVLIPYFLLALEKILTEATPPFQCDVHLEKLRHASIQLLLSILPLPIHYIHLSIPDLATTIQLVSTVQSSTPQTFYSLKNKILSLLFAALGTEKDPLNIQMLLHSVHVFVQDIITYEHSLSVMVAQEKEGGDANRASVSIEDQEVSSINAKATNKDLPLTSLFRDAVVAASNALISWSDSNIVTLAALELLSGLSRLQYDALSHVDCRDAVQCICDFIEKQSQQKPYLHSKSLHTSIVAGFATLITWVMEHPHLLAHESCLTSILRVTEFGMTGTFSKLEDGTVIFKDKKELHPISGRVGEVAEFLLCCVMERCGSFPSPCGAAASGSLLTEEELIKQLPSSKKPQSKFQYYLIDNSLILGLLEGTYSEEPGTLPTVTGIVRGPASRQVWSLQLRHHPRSDIPSSSHLQSRPRPTPIEVPPTCPNLSRPPWPPEADITKYNTSIPLLEQVLDESSSPLHREFSQLTEQQISVESNIYQKLVQYQEITPFPDPSTAQEPPEVTKDFDTARLFLSHLGLLNIKCLRPCSGSRHAPLMMLDSSSLGFRSALGALDRMPTRFCNTVFVVYCRKGQHRVEDILANQISLHNKPQEFLQFLNGLGWIVDPVKHPGFSGRLKPETEEGPRGIGLSAQIPLRPFPYYADAVTELAFILPIQRPSASDSASSIRSVESSDSGPESSSLQSESVPLPPTTSYPTPQTISTWSAPSGSGVSESSVQAVHTGEGDRSGGSIKPGRASTGPPTVSELTDTPKRRTTLSQDCAALVVWLDSFEDHLQFPVETLSALLHKYGKSGKNILPTIFVHRLMSGLYQITTRYGSSSGGPLIDGMVVSRRCLSTLVRRTVINLCMRYRMDNEGYFPPHVKRKRKIEEISTIYGRQLPVANFYSELIVGSTVK